MDCKTAIAIADMYIMAGDILRAVGCPKGAGQNYDSAQGILMVVCGAK